MFRRASRPHSRGGLPCKPALESGWGHGARAHPTPQEGEVRVCPQHATKDDEPAPDDHARGPGLYLRSYGRVWRASAHRGLACCRCGFSSHLGFVRAGPACAGGKAETAAGSGRWAAVPRPGLVSTSSVCLTRKVTSPARASPRSRDARGRDPSSEADVRSVPRGRNHDPCGASERSRHVTFGPVSALRGYALAIPACVRARVATRRVRPRPRIR